MPWFRVDDKMHDHRKVRRTPTKAIGVWTLAGSWSADNLEDGFVPDTIARRWGTPADFKALVAADLWAPADKDGECGWQFLNWDEWQPTKAEVEEKKAGQSDGAAWANHKRWHLDRGQTGDDCDFCNGRPKPKGIR